ncbi:MAG: hypothetical protein K5Q00_07055, partial [Gammaproteobacteria bacterium]|nr:hypothetical protein [Gammaproteobacteria bacterium]
MTGNQRARYTEENVADLAEIYRIRRYLEENKGYLLGFGLNYVLSLLISSLLQNLLTEIFIKQDPNLNAFLINLDKFSETFQMPDPAKGFLAGMAELGSKLQNSESTFRPLLEEYFASVGIFLNRHTLGLFPADYFRGRLPEFVINCAIENPREPLASSAVSSLKALIGKLYDDPPNLGDPGFAPYLAS